MVNTPSQSKNRKPNLSGSTSRSLINQLKDNEAEAWQTLYVLYEPLVRFWCRKQNVPNQDIPDLVQDVFQTVAKSIDRFSIQHRNGSFRGWLRSITGSRVIDWRRRIHGKDQATGGSTAQSFFLAQPFEKTKLVEDPDEIPNTEQEQIQQLYLRALSVIRCHFQEKTWKAFWRVVVDEMTPKEVGRELSISPSTVRVAKSRVLYRLRAELGELDEKTERFQ